MQPGGALARSLTVRDASFPSTQSQAFAFLVREQANTSEDKDRTGGGDSGRDRTIKAPSSPRPSTTVDIFKIDPVALDI
jgi:hypothetical protein